MQAAERFAVWCWGSGYQLLTADSIKTKHLQEYVDWQKHEGARGGGKSVRSIQNDMAALRGCLRVAGRKQFASSVEISNQSLGISGATRRGTKVAMCQEEHELAVSRLIAEGHYGAAAMLDLERYLGLRGEEALRSIKSLETWKKHLSEQGCITVVYGTKGGRPRRVNVPAVLRDKALLAIDQALLVVRQNKGKLIGGELKSAQQKYHAVVRNAGMTGSSAPHSERYWFTEQAVEEYRKRGFTDHESLAMTATDLGHGDGRGRWVQNTYFQKKK